MQELLNKVSLQSCMAYKKLFSAHIKCIHVIINIYDRLSVQYI